MRSIYKVLLYFFVLNIACQNSSKQNNKNQKTDFSSEKSIAYETQSGKIFIVHIDHSIGASICEVQIETKGFTVTNTMLKMGIIDPVKEVFLADLDKNGFEEIYLITECAGSGSYQTLFGIASNNDKSATPIYVRPFSEVQNEKMFVGFMGHNQFNIEKGKMVNSFPVYLDGDSNSKPSGGQRKIEYQLIAGEAGWILEPTTIIKY